MLAIFLLKSLDLQLTPRLIKEIAYLWREFFIKTRIVPRIKEYTISFYYKDNQLIQFNTTDLKDLIKVAEQIKKSRCD